MTVNTSSFGYKALVVYCAMMPIVSVASVGYWVRHHMYTLAMVMGFKDVCVVVAAIVLWLLNRRLRQDKAADGVDPSRWNPIYMLCSLSMVLDFVVQLVTS
uniref:Uncharacterized protein n=1 Tax=mine drainage metagenome TaxID=410659 RepID=E6Q0C1_9ZZZZ